MLTAFLTTLAQMVRIFLFLLLGFGLNRLHILPKGAGSGISKLATSLFLPAMVLHNNMTEFNIANVSSYGRLVLLGGVIWLIVTLLSLPVARKFSGGDVHERGIYLYGLSFPNTGAVGVPLSLALLGTAGLFEFNLFCFTFGLATYLWGVGLFMQVEKRSLLKFLRENTTLLARLSGIIRTRLRRCLIRSYCLLFIDGRQPICFI